MGIVGYCPGGGDNVCCVSSAATEQAPSLSTDVNDNGQQKDFEDKFSAVAHKKVSYQLATGTPAVNDEKSFEDSIQAPPAKIPKSDVNRFKVYTVPKASKTQRRKKLLKHIESAEQKMVPTKYAFNDNDEKQFEDTIQAPPAAPAKTPASMPPFF